MSSPQHGPRPRRHPATTRHVARGSRRRNDAVSSTRRLAPPRPWQGSRDCAGQRAAVLVTAVKSPARPVPSPGVRGRTRDPGGPGSPTPRRRRTRQSRMTAARSRAAELDADCPGWRPSPGEAGRRLDAQEPTVGGAGVMAGLGGKRGDGRKVAGTFGLDHQLGALAVQDLADGAVEQQPGRGRSSPASR